MFDWSGQQLYLLILYDSTMLTFYGIIVKLNKVGQNFTDELKKGQVSLILNSFGYFHPRSWVVILFELLSRALIGATQASTMPTRNYRVLLMFRDVTLNIRISSTSVARLVRFIEKSTIELTLSLRPP